MTSKEEPQAGIRTPDGGWLGHKLGGGRKLRRKAQAVHWFPIGSLHSACGFAARASGDVPFDIETHRSTEIDKSIGDYQTFRRVCGHCVRGDRPVYPWSHLLTAPMLGQLAKEATQ